MTNAEIQSTPPARGGDQMIREQLIVAIAALEKYGSDPVNRHVGLQKLRAQLAALPEPPQPWTERERRLWAQLEWQLAAIDEGFFNDEGLFTCTECSRSAHDDAALIIHTDECCSGRLRAALADTPPPDPRDEALEAAEKALNRIGCDCESCTNALAAIARSKGGK